jgi:two-component system sensor histidine kinase KdpD
MGYRVVAFILLFAVSILAMLVDIIPVILAAFLSALFWDFLFIPPRYTFTVGTVEDRWLLLMYFVIALIHTVLTSKIRQMEREVRTREEKARAVKFYNTVFNSLTHELRTPITTIVGATDNLLSGNTKIADDVKNELLLEINVAALRLNRQVENLLSMSRLESGIIKANKNWVDVRELVYNTLKEFETQSNRHKISVNIADQLPLFKLDYGLMEQVIHNLVTNAIQHTPEQTDIIISAAVSDEKLMLTISDTGKGFSTHDIDKVFDKFYRVKGSKAGGTGLGLSIVRGFIEAHHGTISLRNLPLSGAEFCIEIPTEITYINKLKNE